MKYIIRFIFILLTIICLSNLIIAQSNDKIKLYDNPLQSINKKRLATVLGTEGTLYLGSMSVLYTLWYRNYPMSSFHFFNDNKEWLFMDKMGHITTANYVSNFGYKLLKWSGVKEKKAVVYGSLTALLFQTTIEVFDGFSKEWGFSYGDMLGNVLGASLFVTQQLLWKEQRMIMKWSYHPSKYAKYRPDLLGSSWNERILKDYNGQTYWLSINIKSFLPKHIVFPAWFNIAIGYGAEGMTGAEHNATNYNGKPIPEYERYSHYYFSLDVDLSKIPVKAKWLKTIFNTLNVIKFPFPTFDFNKHKASLYFIYF